MRVSSVSSERRNPRCRCAAVVVTVAPVLVVAAEVDAASPVVTGEVRCLEVAGPDESEELLVSGGAKPIEDQP